MGKVTSMKPKKDTAVLEFMQFWVGDKKSERFHQLEVEDHPDDLGRQYCVYHDLEFANNRPFFVVIYFCNDAEIITTALHHLFDLSEVAEVIENFNMSEF